VDIPASPDFGPLDSRTWAFAVGQRLPVSMVEVVLESYSPIDSVSAFRNSSLTQHLRYILETSKTANLQQEQAHGPVIGKIVVSNALLSGTRDHAKKDQRSHRLAVRKFK
jgi:hypothetical protein